MVALALVIALTSVMAIVLNTGDDVAETPVTTTDMPALSEIDPHENPEVRGATGGLVVTPQLSEIDPHENPEVLGRTVGVVVTPQLSEIDPHQSPEAVR